MDKVTLSITVQPTNLSVLTQQSSIQSNSDANSLVLRNNSEATIIIESVENQLRYQPQKIKLLTAGFQGEKGEKGADGTGTGSGGITWDELVPANSSKVINSYATVLETRKWLVSARSIDDSKFSTYQIAATYAPDVDDIQFSRFSILGSRILHSSIFAESAGTVTHTIQNNMSEDIVVSLIQN